MALRYLVLDLVAGGVSNVVAKGVGGPFDRVKLILQVQVDRYQIFVIHALG